MVKVLPLGVIVMLLPAASETLPGSELRGVTTSLVGQVWPGAKLICPLEAMDSLGSAALLDPDPKSKFNVPEGEDVLFPAASACHWNVSLDAELELLLNADAWKSTGSELLPLVEVAVPVDGS